MAILEGNGFLEEIFSNETNGDLFLPAGPAGSIDASANDYISLTPFNDSDVIFSDTSIGLGQYDNNRSQINEAFTNDYFLVIENFDVTQDRIFMNSPTGIWEDEAILRDCDGDGQQDDTVVGLTNSIGISDGNMRDWMYVFLDTSPSELGYSYSPLTNTYTKILNVYPPVYVLTDRDISKDDLIKQYSGSLPPDQDPIQPPIPDQDLTEPPIPGSNSDVKINELTTTVLRKSKGRTLEDGDRLLVRYQGKLLNGEQFDANFDFKTFEADEGRVPFQFVLGEGQVIKGFDQGLKGQKLGSVVEIKIPANLAYGESGSGMIPPNSTLIFTVEVMAIIPANDTTPIYLDFKNIGIKSKKLGVTDKLLSTVQSERIGMDLNDELIGSEKTDLLIGLKGKDTLYGGNGADVLIGGKGKDRFLYADKEDSLVKKKGRDIILDFGKKDKINLQALSDELQFIKQAKFTGMAGEVRFAKETLSIDINGDKAADFTIALPGVEELKGSNLQL